VTFFGEPPKPRLAVMVFESMEKKVGDKYAKFRVHAVEGPSQ
jgi:hypothetical protein